jgi:uncharacterized membrane protein YraQ (UPF0718 family)
VLKGAHFVAAVAFMFASTNLVVELGILILIFLGWQFLAAEIVGGLLLILVSSILIRLTYPRAWLEAARAELSRQADDEDGDFDWRRRLLSRQGWYLAGRRFRDDWSMVWEEILIGFTVAGFMAVLVPPGVWSVIFVERFAGDVPGWLAVAQNAVVAPLVAATTFIGSMGNIPLATVLNTNGVAFAGIMGFIYSDLMVPPLVMINAKYYGWQVALYIAGVMFASIVATALAMHFTFAALGITPGSERRVTEVAAFGFDYTFYLNLIFAVVAGIFVWLGRRHEAAVSGGGDHDHHDDGGTSPKRIVALSFLAILLGGVAASLLESGLIGHLRDGIGS